MKPLLRALALGVGPLMVVAGFSVVGGRAVLPEQFETPTPVVSTACSQPPIFAPGYQRGENYVVPQGEGFKFNGDAWIEANLCSAGILKITAVGELAGDEEPQLTIVLDTEFLTNVSFDKERTFQIQVPHAGRISLGFFNDYYLADVRVAYLRDIKLTAPSCEGFKSVDIPKESAGIWYPASRTASLVYDPPMTIIPCGAGKLSMRVQGLEGNGAFPILTIWQDGRKTSSIQTSLNSKAVNVALEALPATISVSNAYGMVIADRNLIVHRIEFIPSQP